MGGMLLSSLREMLKSFPKKKVLRAIDTNTSLVAVILLLIGLFLRSIFPLSGGINFDQVQILEKANEISKGDISLIGPRTGPANMFTGPLIYYVTAPFVMVLDDYTAVVLVPLLLAGLTGVALFWLSKVYLEEKAALVITGLWAMSPFLIALDRVFWNPNLMVLASALVFFPLLQLKGKWYDYVFLGCGAFLSYQAHFSGFVLVGLGILSLLAQRQSWKYFAVLILGLATSLFPTFLFDLRNNFLNWYGLQDLLFNKSSRSFAAILKDLWKNIFIVIETTGKVLLEGNQLELILTMGIFVFVLYFFFTKRVRQEQNMILLWLGSVVTAFTLYRGSKPEYYFLLVIPVIFYIFARLVKNVKRKWIVLALLLIAVYSWGVTHKKFSHSSGFTVGSLYEMETIFSKMNIKEVVYDVPHGGEAGPRYFLQKYAYADGKDVVHIGYPSNITFWSAQKISDVVIWVDPRTKEQTEVRNFLVSDSVILSTDRSTFLYENKYPENALQDVRRFVVIQDDKPIGMLSTAYEGKVEIPWVENCPYNTWSMLEQSGVFQVKQKDHCLLLELDSMSTLADVEKLNITVE